MTALSDHVRRDAENAAYSDIRVQVSRYTRRMAELAKGEIKEAIESATQTGEAIDGVELGRAAAASALAAYMGAGSPQQAIAGSADVEHADTNGAGAALTDGAAESGPDSV